MTDPRMFETLLGAWVHSHEEDEPGRKVFRRDDYPFPPSRGRRGYEFHPDGRVVARGPGPDDRTTAAVGTWTLEADGRLVLVLPGAGQAAYQVVALEGTRLELSETRS